jgi:Zn-dependent protease
MDSNKPVDSSESANTTEPAVDNKSSGFVAFLVSMVVSLACYWYSYGVASAIALTLIILVHEMGHFVYMHKERLHPRYPFFVPYLGAFVSMTNVPQDPMMRAWVSLAGPLVGGLGALACYCAGMITGSSYLVVAANYGFLLNLLQLVPLRPFDGGFIAESVSKWLLIPGAACVALLACSSSRHYLPLWLLPLCCRLQVGSGLLRLLRRN